MATILLISSLLTIGFAKECDTLKSAEYITEEYLVLEFYELNLTDETNPVINLKYESGRTETASKAESMAEIEANEYYIIMPEGTEETIKLLISADCEHSSDRVTQVILNTDEMEETEQFEVTVNNSIKNIQLYFLHYNPKGKSVNESKLYPECYINGYANIPYGLADMFYVELTTPNGEKIVGTREGESVGICYTFKEEGTYIFSLMCNGKACEQIEKTVISEKEGKSAAFKESAESVLAEIGNGLIEILTAPLLLVLYLNPVFLAFTGGPLLAPVALLKGLIDYIGEIF